MRSLVHVSVIVRLFFFKELFDVIYPKFTQTHFKSRNTNALENCHEMTKSDMSNYKSNESE